MPKKVIVHRIERYIQQVEVEVDETLPALEQAKQAQQMVANDEGSEVGELEYHSTSQSPENWSVYNDEGKQIG